MATRSLTSSVLLLLMSIVICSATSNTGISSSFPINSLLTCNIRENVPEDRFRVPLQPGPSGAVWLPVDTAFQRPPGQPDASQLLQFLGNEFNNDFTSLTRPTANAPRAIESLPVTGSGGQEMLFRPDMIMPNFGDLDPQAVAIVESWIMSQGLGACEVQANWTLLPNTFFPAYFSGQYCRGGSCSFPPGLTCSPDIGDDRITFITMLRWDCCWNFADRRWRWECGWRKVDIPLFVDCACLCQPRLRNPGEFD